MNLFREERMERLDRHAGMKADGLLVDTRRAVITGKKNRTAKVDNPLQVLARRKCLLVAAAMEQPPVRRFI